MILPVPAFAQYQLYHWANFEEGRIPQDVVMFGAKAHTDMRLVELDQVAGVAPGFRSDAARQETGRFALQLKADPKSSATQDFLMGLTAGVLLDRDSLEAKRKALYQADFYIPESGNPIPELAVLATEPLTMQHGRPSVPRSFYRFGVRANGAYYSRIYPGQNTDYRQDSSILARIPRPGWHRLAIVFEGHDTLRCYIDGREPSFSPVKDATLRRLQVGVMLAEDRRWYDCYVDNLSIQVGEDVKLPDSPYAAGWSAPPAGGGSGTGGTARPAGNTPPAVGASSSIAWLADPTVAWNQARQQGRPLLLYFMAPSVPATAQLEQVLASTPQAKKFLDRHVCAKVDINQLQGGAAARQYGIYRVPCFLIISPDAKELSRATFTKEDTWASFYEQLE